MPISHTYLGSQIGLLLIATLFAPSVFAEGTDELGSVEGLAGASVATLEAAEKKSKVLAKTIKTLVAADGGKGADDAPSDPDAKDNPTGESAQLPPLEPREGELSTQEVPKPRNLNLSEVERNNLLDAVGQRPTDPDLLKRLTRLVAGHPADYTARLMLTRSQLLVGDSHTAVDTIQPLLETRSADWQTWFWSGTAHLKRNDLQLAREHLLRALDLGGQRASTWVQMAVLEQQQGEHHKALNYLSVAQQVQADYWPIYLNRAYSLEHVGQLDAARLAYRNYLVRRKSNHRASPALGLVLDRLGELATQP